jgi:prepilin-type N-terminal cleavage/methylation domain-containing protein
VLSEPASEDAGFTLVETMVAIVLVTIAIFALSAELTAYLHHQANERARTTAVRLMTTSVENARRLTASQLAAIPAGTAIAPPTTDGGRTYTTTEVIQRCSVNDAASTCTTPASSADLDTRVRVTVSWADGTETRSVSTYTSVADDSATTYTPSGSGSLSTLLGGTGQAASGVSVAAFTASPSSATVSASGVPSSAITLALTTVGLTSATSSIPVTWTDDAGSHQWSLTGGPSSWTATIPATSISKVVASGTDTVTFAATVPGTTSLATTSVTLRAGVSFSSCSVTPNPIVLTVLTRKTSLVETLTCTTSGLSATDTVSASYASGSGTATKSLTSTNGTTWTATLSSGTTMASSGLLETFTFTATRAADGRTATATANGVLA